MASACNSYVMHATCLPTQRIIHGCAQLHVLPYPLHEHHQIVPARYQQAQKREGHAAADCTATGALPFTTAHTAVAAAVLIAVRLYTRHNPCAHIRPLAAATATVAAVIRLGARQGWFR
eukprot:1136973-Pelagomonas_calceolata.AAC.5